MSNSLGGVRVSAVGLALLAAGSVSCISTGEPLFTEDVESLEPAAPGQMLAPALPAQSTGPVASPSAPTVAPEQLSGVGRDTTPLPSSVPAGNEATPPEPAADAEPLDPCGGDGLILCDNFESSVEGEFPAADGWLPELAGCGSHNVDGMGPAFSGTRALRADDGGYPECMLHADSSGEAELFVRTRVYLGDGEAQVGQYVSLLEFGARPDQDDPELRIGVRPVVDSICTTPGLDVTGTGLSTGSRTDCTGFVLEPARWYCIEGHLTRSGADLNLTISVDGAEVTTRQFTGSSVWSGSDLFVKLGRAAYGVSGSGSVWHDDIAVSRTPTPCGF
ncbi:MAG TPA: hypothetical protein VMG12_16665 [Polyangiaceae bacterium]|nr:hypothetical protein [Polyangiaceae bacterium]